MAAAILRLHELRSASVHPNAEEKVEPTSPSSDQELDVAEWSQEQVGDWLESIGRPELAQSILTNGVDGRVLLKLDGEAWTELGVSSALERAKILAAVERASRRSAAAAPLPATSSVAVQDALGGKQGPKAETRVRKHFWPRRTFQGGREHSPDWFLAIANANSDPSVVKEHTLRFLGTYSIIDLLVFTINTSYLIGLFLGRTPVTSVPGWLILLLHCSAATQSMYGMIVSTVVYSVASAVSGANFIVFAKLPAMTKAMLYVNDCSISSAFLTAVSILPLVYSICIDFTCLPSPVDRSSGAASCVPAQWVLYPGGEPIDARWYYTVGLFVITTLQLFAGWYTAVYVHIANTTHLAMFGGLFGSDPIPPLAEDPTWAHRSSPEGLVKHVAAEAIANAKAKGSTAVGVECAQMYAERTVASLREAATGAVDMMNRGGASVDAASGPLRLTLESIIGIAGWAGRSGKGGGQGHSLLPPRS